jgi:ribosomal-protein-alanine N-acetyltransferase
LRDEGFEIRPTRSEDLRAMADLELEVFAAEGPWSLNELVADYRTEGRIYLSAIAQATIVGYAGMETDGQEAVISSLAVAPVWRGRGVARNLLQAILTRGEAADIKRVTLQVRVDNARARNLYELAGFKVTALLSGFYSEEQDALEMVKVLP